MIKISVVIPTKNAGPEFAQTLQRLTSQSARAEVELLIIDSGSIDGTPRMAEQHGAQVIHIDPASFNHGETRNAAIAATSGEVIVLTVQDAVPTDDYFIERFVSWFEREEKVAGVFGKQVARADADALARWEVHAHNRLFDKGPRLKSITSVDEFLAKDFLGRFDLTLFDNVCSAVRRSVWQQFPFHRMEFAEDLDWALRVMLAGHAVAHDPTIQVLHSHNRPSFYRLKRHFVTTKCVLRVLRCEPEDFSSVDDAQLFADSSSFADAVFTRINEVSRSGSARISLSNVDSILIEPEPTGKIAQKASQVWSSLKQVVSSTQTSPNASPSRGQTWDMLRATTNHTLRELVEFHGSLDASTAVFLLENVLARAVGDVWSKYYYWCESRGVLSSILDRVGRFLSQGI